MAEDWFAQNAPKAASSGDDWFAKNAPKPEVEVPPAITQPKPELQKVISPWTAVKEFGKGFVQTIPNMVMHPLESAASMGQPFTATGVAPGGMYPTTAPTGPLTNIGEQRAVQGVAQQGQTEAAQQIADNPAYFAGGLASQIAAAKLLSGPGARALKATSESFRKTAQTLVGAGEKSVKTAVGKAAEDANTARDTTLAKNQKADEATLEERGKVDEANAKQAEEDRIARQKVMQQNREASQAHGAEKARIEAENRQALRDQEKLTPTQAKLDEASSEMRARVETARENALKEGNKTYNAVNSALDQYDSDPETIRNLNASVIETVPGEKMPPLVKEFDSRVFGEDKAGTPQGPPTYDELQGFYSKLGNALSKGTLDGETYHAYDVLHEGIGDEMQRIASDHGMGEQLKAARDYWRRMKQTFGKPFAMNDAATAAVKGANPEFLTDEAQANRLRLLGSFDAEIPKVAEHIGNLKTGLEALPKAKPIREVVKIPPAAPEPAPAPQPTPPKSYGEPHPTTPTEIPDVNTREIREKFVDKWASGESSLNKWQVRALLSGGIGGVVGLLVGKGVGLEVAGAVSAGTYVLGPAMIAKLLDSPRVVEWFTRPPAAELETLQRLPNADRIRITDGLDRLAAEAQKRGVNVDPRILALGATLAGPKTRELKKLRK